MTDYSNLVKRQREISEASYKMRDNIYRPVNETADALEAKDAEIDYWKNRTREALETINHIERIAQKQSDELNVLRGSIANYQVGVHEARIAELEAALRPFADASDLHLGSDDMSIAFRIIIGNLRQAKSVLDNK